jgi:hypothetical protein
MGVPGVITGSGTAGALGAGNGCDKGLGYEGATTGIGVANSDSTKGAIGSFFTSVSGKGGRLGAETGFCTGG